MVKANDLRIGNWIQLGGNTIDTYQTYKPYKVTIDAMKEIAEENEERPDAILSVFQPIKITPEILEQCGFEKDEHLTVLNIEIGEYDFISINLYQDKKWYLWCQGDHLGNGFEYLHQLQNLFYALTGEELKVELKEKAGV